MKSEKLDAENYLFTRSMPEPMSGCWLWSGYIDALGYGRANHPKEKKAHRIMWTMFNGEIPDGKKILHRCDVRCCVNPEHLFIGTQADNVADMMEKGRNKCVPQKGEKNPMSKLNQNLVLEMRQFRNDSGLSYSKIAKKYAISTMTAFRAITKQSWSN
jgi:hypothetical protein